MPRFVAPTVPLRAALVPVVTGSGILGIGILPAFFGSCAAFVRYDVW